MKSAGKWAKRDLWVSVIDNPDGRRLRIVYNAALYRPERLQRVLRDFEHLIEQIVVGHAPQLSGLAPAGPLEAIAPPAQANESVPSTFQREGPAMATLNKVAAIWSETLRVDAPSEDVSFFNQGGDSLLLLRLIHRIEEEFGQSFPLGEAFQSPTIGHIAACLERSPQRLHQPRDRDILLEPLLRDRPTRTCLPKFFFVSGGGGHVAPFAQIARLLEDRWEMIGVKDPALFAQEPAIANIEDLASRMMRAVLSADANGPWILAGYSAGGRTVYEIARQLRDAGGAAGCVVIDAGVSENGLANATLRMMRKMKRTGRVAVRRVDDEFARLRESADADGLRDKERRHYRRVSDVQHGRLLRYTPKPSDTPVALVRAVASGRRVKDQDYGWSALTHFVSAFNTPGDHFNCFRAPHQGAFASSLAQALDAVAARVWHDPPNPKVRTDDS
jgi:thioesterase domain-containing protein/acyl carrier protein